MMDEKDIKAAKEELCLKFSNLYIYKSDLCKYMKAKCSSSLKYAQLYILEGDTARALRSRFDVIIQ
jgi:hypothetical protein